MEQSNLQLIYVYLVYQYPPLEMNWKTPNCGGITVAGMVGCSAGAVEERSCVCSPPPRGNLYLNYCFATAIKNHTTVEGVALHLCNENIGKEWKEFAKQWLVYFPGVEVAPSTLRDRWNSLLSAFKTKHSLSDEGAGREQHPSPDLPHDKLLYSMVFEKQTSKDEQLREQVQYNY